VRYGYTDDRRGYYFRLPGFMPLNGYIWSGLDGHGRSNVLPGRSLWRRRLDMLRLHFLPYLWWKYRRVFWP